MKRLILPPMSYRHPERHIEALLTHPWYATLSRLHSEILRLTHEFYTNEKIAPMMLPITTGSVSSPMGLGSDSLPVKVTFDRTGLEVYLADSMQFSLELGARLSEKGAYYVMPTFRGEDVDSRHLNEFVHSEVEIKGDLEDIIGLAERYIKHMNKGLLATCADDIAAIAGDVEHVRNNIDREFHRITFTQAIEELASHEGAYRILPSGAYDITPIGEKILMNTHGDFTWLTHLPWSAVPFYQKQNEDNPELSNTADLLAGIGEILGLGQRTLAGDEIDASLEAHDVELHGYEWYREMHDQHPIQTSGFGLGVERYILWLLRHDDIRDCSILLRDHKLTLYP